MFTHGSSTYRGYIKRMNKMRCRPQTFELEWLSKTQHLTIQKNLPSFMIDDNLLNIGFGLYGFLSLSFLNESDYYMYYNTCNNVHI
jgi:hypothetical protein